MKTNSDTITTEKQVLARVAEARSLAHQGLNLDAFRRLEGIPPDQLFTASGLDLYFTLVQELNAWGDGIALAYQIQLEHPMDVRLAGCEFLTSYGGHLLKLSKMASDRSMWLVGSDPDEEPEQDPEIRSEDSQPRRPDLN